VEDTPRGHTGFGGAILAFVCLLAAPSVGIFAAAAVRNPFEWPVLGMILVGAAVPAGIAYSTARYVVGRTPSNARAWALGSAVATGVIALLLLLLIAWIISSIDPA
jgi:hypothetical protein